jgi:hypothetical protein
MDRKQGTPEIDPLRRVFVYNNDRFQTTDGVWYARRPKSDTIRRQISKVRGKSARRADKAARRLKHGA